MEFDLTDRVSLIASLPKGGVWAEIGVAEGGFSAVILDRCKPRHLWLIDCWEHQDPELYGDDPANHPQEYMDAEYAEVVKRFADEPVSVVRKYSIDAAADFYDDTFDAVYLDGNHLQAYEDAEAWWPKVKSGGYLLGHDYTVAGNFITVKRDIDRWVAEKGLTIHVAGLESDNIYERNYPSYAIQKP